MSQSHSGVLQPPCPVSRCQPFWGRDVGVIHGRDSGLPSLTDGGVHGLPAAATRANFEADAWGYLHTTTISSAVPGSVAGRSCVSAGMGHGGHAVWPCNPGHFRLFMVNVQCSMKLAVCFWRGRSCHPTFRSSATCPAHAMGPFLTQGLGKSREVVSWRQNNTYRCGLAVIH